MEMKRIVIVTDAVDGRGNETNGVKVGRALRRLNYDVRLIDHRGISRDALHSAALVLAFGTLVRAEANKAGYFDAIVKAKDDSTPFALWYFDLCNPFMKHDTWKYPTLAKVVDRLDLLAMTDHSHAWDKRARRFLHLMQGVEPADFAMRVAPPEPRRTDVIFTGGMVRPFQYRHDDVRALSKAKLKVETYGRGSSRRVYGKAFFDAYQRAKVALVPGPPKEAADGYWSNRIYLAAATGTPCVVGYTKGLESHYANRTEVLFYRDTAELVTQTKRLVSDPALRLTMGRAARMRTLTEHTYDERCKALMAAVFG